MRHQQEDCGYYCESGSRGHHRVSRRGWLLGPAQVVVTHAIVCRVAVALGVAAVVTSLVFGLLHLANPDASWLGALNISLLGLVLVVPVIATSSLSVSIGLHMGWNVFQNNVFGAPNSGKPSLVSALVTEADGSVLWSGGAFGPEASLVVTGVLGLGLVAACWACRGTAGGRRSPRSAPRDGAR